MHDLAVLFEHPAWQEPLFSALRARGVDFIPIDLKRAAYQEGNQPRARLYFNQASPSAYVRGHTRAVPYALALMESLEIGGARVLNGARAFSLELSKAAQVALMRKLGIDCPKTIVFNEPSALANIELTFPAILKPNQGGSGARMFQVDALGDLEKLFRDQPELWLPDNLFLLQELLQPHEGAGIVRLEFLGGELLYAMRVIAPGQFNLCPSETCHPTEEGGEAICEVPKRDAAAPVQFIPYPEVPREAVEAATRIVRAGGLDVGGIEYLETVDGRRVFYDVNANSNLRPSVAQAFGFDPFERVVDYLLRELSQTK